MRAVAWKSMKAFRESFRNIKHTYDQRHSGESALICKQGFYGGCPVLKLQKASWTNDSMRKVRNKTGIFFSVWLDEKGIKQNRAHYNIHALKLRQLTDYALTSNTFANAWRKGFTPMAGSWPHISMDFGPQTLMQGWIEMDLATFEDDVLILMERFGEQCWVIDDLLARS